MEDLSELFPVELLDRIQDSDEKVRGTICKVIGSLDYETILHHIDTLTLRAVGGRMSDKKVCHTLKAYFDLGKSAVRTEASAALAKMWTTAYSDM